MKIAALITWIVTAGGGSVLLGTWLRRGGNHEPQAGQTRLRPPLIFGHFLLAAIGLVVWIVYVLADLEALTWIAFVLLLPVALLGFTMFARWLGVRGERNARATAATTPAGAAGMPSSAVGAAGTGAGAEALPEAHFPVAVVLAHGVLAVVTVVLVLLVALGVGGS